MDDIEVAKIIKDNNELKALLFAVIPAHVKINTKYKSVTVKFVDGKYESATNADYEFAIARCILKRLLGRKELENLLANAERI